MVSTDVGRNDLACPVCQSSRTERVDEELTGIAYRCVECNAEFDTDGARVRF